MISILLILLSNISLELVKSFALFNMLSKILSYPQWVDCGLLSFLNHSCHSNGSMLSVSFHRFVFLASLPFPKMSWDHYSQVGLSSVTWYHEKNALCI